MYNNNGDLRFDDEPVDLTAPGRSQAAQENYQRYQNDISRMEDPFIMKFTGILLKAAMVGILVFLLYLISLGAFNIDKKIPLIRNVGIAIYAVFILDSIVMSILNKKISIILIALIFPIFYPLKRSSVTYDKKNLQALWLAGVLVLTGVVTNNLYPQLYERFQLMKTSRDDYTSECSDAVKYLKGVKVESGYMIIEVIKDNIDDYELKAEKSSDGTYKITVIGDTELLIDGVIEADLMIKDNTKFVFTVSSTKDSYSVSGLEINGENQAAYAKAAWAQICNQ